MKKILLLSLFCIFVCSCNKSKQYKYIETIKEKSIFGDFEEKNKEPKLFNAQNDSLAYIEAYNYFFISKKVANDMLKENMEYAQIPTDFILSDIEGNLIARPNISQHSLDSIEAYIMDIDSGIHSAMSKAKNINNEHSVDSNTIKKLSPLFSFKKDEFSPDGITRIKPKSAPKYVNRNGIFCTFIKRNAGVENFTLNIQYYADDWLFIRKYQFSIDGKAYEFIPLNVERDNDYGMIWEWCNEKISNAQDKSLIKALANAKSARIKFIGDQYYDIKTITTKDLKSIKDALDLYVAMGGKW